MKVISPHTIKRFLLAAGVALAVSALAHGGGPDACGGMPGEGMPPHLKGLKLSEAQRDKVFELMHAQVPAMRDKAKSLHRAEEDLGTLVASPDYSEAKARILADVSARAMSDMAVVRARTDRQIFELLTPEQRQQLAEQKERPNMGCGESPRGLAGDHSGRPPMR
jgi:Spy/CpxP family protein refolding chaperone